MTSGAKTSWKMTLSTWMTIVTTHLKMESEKFVK